MWPNGLQSSLTRVDPVQFQIPALNPSLRLKNIRSIIAYVIVHMGNRCVLQTVERTSA